MATIETLNQDKNQTALFGPNQFTDKTQQEKNEVLGQIQSVPPFNGNHNSAAKTHSKSKAKSRQEMWEDDEGEWFYQDEYGDVWHFNWETEDWELVENQEEVQPVVDPIEEETIPA